VKSKSKRSTVAPGQAGHGGNGKSGPPETWVNQAVEVWAKYQGTVSHGKAGGLLKPLVGQHGEAETLRRLRIFAAGDKARFGLAHFVEHFQAFRDEPDSVVTRDGVRIPLIGEYNIPPEYRYREPAE